MKNSRERNILIVVMGVAGLGLLVDRVIIGSDVTGPAESSAGIIDGFDPDALDPADLLISQAGVSDAALSAPKVSMAQRLREAIGDTAEAQPDQTRDAFTPSPGWQSVALSPSGTTDNASQQWYKEFQAKHPLEAVMALGDRHYAVIGGQTIHIGQQVDGCELVAVHERSATFQRGASRFEVQITTAPATP